MTIDDLKKVLEGSDLSAALPDLNGIMDSLAPIMKLALLAGPVILLVMGLLYLFVVPKEANYSFGYRCYFGMGSVNAWRYTQRLAGMVFTGVGLILTLVMLGITGSFREMDVADMLWKAVKCGIWEASVIGLANIGIQAAVAFYFDGKGRLRRRRKKAPQAEPQAEPEEIET